MSIFKKYIQLFWYLHNGWYFNIWIWGSRNIWSIAVSVMPNGRSLFPTWKSWCFSPWLFQGVLFCISFLNFHFTWHWFCPWYKTMIKLLFPHFPALFTGNSFIFLQYFSSMGIISQGFVKKLVCLWIPCFLRFHHSNFLSIPEQYY